MQRSRSRLPSNPNRAGYGYGSRESEEDHQLKRVMEKFRSMRPYLNRSLKAILDAGRELELADTVDDINMYLTIMDDLIAEEYHGVETINGFIEKIQEIIRSLPYSGTIDESDTDENAGSSERRIPTEGTRSDTQTPTENKDTRHLANDIWTDSSNTGCQYLRRSGAETKALNETEDQPFEKFRYGRGRGIAIQASASSIDSPGKNYRDLNEDERSDRHFGNQSINGENPIRGRGAGRGRIPAESAFGTYDDNRTERRRSEDRNRNFGDVESDPESVKDNFGESLNNHLFDRRPTKSRPHSTSNYDYNILDVNEDPQFENDPFPEYQTEDGFSDWTDPSPKINNRAKVVPNPNFIPSPARNLHSNVDPRTHVSNEFHQPMDNSLANQNITPAMLKEAIKQGIQEALALSQGNNMAVPGTNNRIMHIPDINNLLNQNMQTISANVSHSIQNSMGMGYVPQPNRYQGPSNNFAFQNNPGLFRNQIPDFPDNHHFDPHENIHDPQSEINRQFREKARNHFLSPGIRIRPVFGRRNGPTTTPRPTSTSTLYRNTLVATNQMQAEPPSLDPRLNRSRNTPVTNQSNPEVQNEPIDPHDPIESDPPNKRRISLAQTNDVPKALNVTRNRVITNLPSRKQDKINKLSEFRKQIEKGGMIKLGDKNRKNKAAPKSPERKSPSKASHHPSPQRSETIKSKSSFKASNGNPDISEDERGFKTKGTLKLKFKIPKLSKKNPATATTVTEDATQLVREFVYDSVSTADIENLKTNPETFKELCTKLQNTYDEISTIKVNGKHSRPLLKNSGRSERGGTDPRETERSPVRVQYKEKSVAEIFQETLQELRDESVLQSGSRFYTSKSVCEDPNESMTMMNDESEARIIVKNMPKKATRTGIAYKKPVGKRRTSKTTARKTTKSASNKNDITDAKKVAFKKSGMGKRGRKAKSDEQKNEDCGKESGGDKAGSGNSDLFPKRYLTRLQARMTAKPPPGPTQGRTGWEKWNKRLDSIREMWKRQNKSGEKFREKLRKRKIQLKNKLDRGMKRKVETNRINSDVPLKKSRVIAGANNIVVNAGLGKIKIESDYVESVTIKTEMNLNIQDDSEFADMNHLNVDYSRPAENSAFSLAANLLAKENISEFMEKERDIGFDKLIIPRDLANNLSETGTKKDDNLRDKESFEELLEKSLEKESEATINDLSKDIVVGKDQKKKVDLNLVNCTLCDFNGKNIVAHYVNGHLNSTIPSACINQETFEKLTKLNQSGSPQLFEISYSAENGENLWPCLYCSQRHSDLKDFFEHLTIHTGEFQYACNICAIRYPHFKAMVAHLNSHQLESAEIPNNLKELYKPSVSSDGNELFGYLCHDCHYFQLLSVNIARHLEAENHSCTEAISIRFHCPPKQKLDPVIKKEPIDLPQEIDIKEEIKLEKEDFLTRAKANLTEREVNMIQSELVRQGPAACLKDDSE